MADVDFSTSFLKDFAKYFANYKYIALDASSTAYDKTTQSGPLSELTTNGAARAAADTSFDADTGILTMSKRFVFTGPAPAKGVVPMNSPTAGQGIGMYRYLPPAGVLPDGGFDVGGSLLVNIQCSNVGATA